MTYQTPAIAQDRFTAPIAKEIWEKKYRFAHHDGEIIDHTVEDTWTRVAKALAQAEGPKKRKHWEAKFYKARPHHIRCRNRALSHLVQLFRYGNCP